MAKCVGNGCGINWQWDWGQDSYRNADTEEFCTEEKVFVKDEMEVSLLRCPGCKTVISVFVVDPQYGAGPFNHPDWDGVNWESKENCWPKQ